MTSPTCGWRTGIPPPRLIPFAAWCGGLSGRGCTGSEANPQLLAELLLLSASWLLLPLLALSSLEDL